MRNDLSLIPTKHLLRVKNLIKCAINARIDHKIKYLNHCNSKKNCKRVRPKTIQGTFDSHETI